MPEFLRVGNHLVNLDQVTELVDTQDIDGKPCVTVYFGAERSRFYGREMVQWLSWMELHRTIEDELQDEPEEPEHNWEDEVGELRAASHRFYEDV